MRRQLPPPWELFPLPRGVVRYPLPDPLGIFRTQEEEATKPSVRQEGCAYGWECVRDHMLRAHLYLTEAVRFSSEGEITAGAREKIRLARQQLLCEDDYSAALKVGPPVKYEILKHLASARSVWKAIERSGLDRDGGDLEDLQQVTNAVKALVDKAYELDQEVRGAA